MTGSQEPGQSLLDRLRSLTDERDMPITALEPSEILIKEGQDSDTVFILIDGALEVTKSVDGRRAVLADLTVPGTVVGEMVSMGAGRRTATVTASSTAELYSLPAERFHSLVSSDRELALYLSELAVRRAEETELAEILVERFGLNDTMKVASACASVDWLSLEPGERLFTKGDPADRVFFVVRGRLKSEHGDVDGPEEPKAVAKGDVIGDLSVLLGEPRLSTVTALRHSVVAAMGAKAFIGLADDQPRLLADLALSAVSRYVEASPRSSPATIIALAAPAFDRDRLIGALCRGLSATGEVGFLSAEVVDSLLETPGVANSGAEDVGDVRVSRLVHEFELDSDHLLIDIGDEDTPWARRALGLADRIIIAISDHPSAGTFDRIHQLIASCRPGIPRTLMVEHLTSEQPQNTAQMLDRLGCGDVLHVVKDSHLDLARVARVITGRATCLVLGGGGARGFAHVGAYQALSELGVDIDVVAGTSIGAVLGAAIADGLTPLELMELVTDNFSGILDYTLPVVSLIKGQKIAKLARQYYGDRDIVDLRNQFLCVSTDLTRSRPYVHVDGPVVTAIRATSAIPGVMPPVPVGDALLVDGGVLNNLPIDIACTTAPVGRILAIDVAPPRGPGAHGDYGLSVSGWKALRSNTANGKSQYPRLSSVLMRSMITASMHERDRQVAIGLADFYINLDMRGVSMLDFSAPAAVAARGYETVMPALESWLTAQDDT